MLVADLSSCRGKIVSSGFRVVGASAGCDAVIREPLDS